MFARTLRSLHVPIGFSSVLRFNKKRVRNFIKIGIHWRPKPGAINLKSYAEPSRADVRVSSATGGGSTKFAVKGVEGAFSGEKSLSREIAKYL